MLRRETAKDDRTKEEDEWDKERVSGQELFRCPISSEDF